MENKISSSQFYQKYQNTFRSFSHVAGCIAHRHKQFRQLPWGQWRATPWRQLRLGHRLLMYFSYLLLPCWRQLFSETQLPANLRKREKISARGHHDAFDWCCSSNYGGIRTHCLDYDSALYMFYVWTYNNSWHGGPEAKPFTSKVMFSIVVMTLLCPDYIFERV